MEENLARDMERVEGAGLSGDEETRLRSVVDIFSRLSIACKSRSLYPAEHPTAVDAVILLHAVMEDSLGVTPNLVVKVGKDSLICDGHVVAPRMESLHLLASRIRSLNIREIAINAGVSFKEAEALVELLVCDADELDKAGGPESFLLVKGVNNINVVESSAQRTDEEKEEAELRAGAEPEPRPEEEEGPVSVAPDQVGDLLELLLDPERLGRTLMALSGENGEPLAGEELADAAFAFLKTAGAIMAREHPERERDCLRCMAESLLFLDTEVRNQVLLRRMLPGLRDEPFCPAVLNQFNAQEMADLLSYLLPLIPELTPKTGSLLKAIGFRDNEVRHAVRLLLAKLVDLGQIPPPLLASLEAAQEIGVPAGRKSSQLPTLEEVNDILGEYRPEELDEIRHISEFDPMAVMPMDTTPMLLDLLGKGGSLDNPGKALELLEQNFWTLAMSAELVMAAEVLRGSKQLLQNIDPAIDPYRSDLQHMLEEASSDRVIKRIIALACSRRGDRRMVEGLKRYTSELGEKGVSAMVEALGAEEDMSVRKYIVDTLIALCRDRVQLLGAYMDDPRWFLVRNIITILARIHTPEAIPYLRKAFYHPNPKVKAETIRALGLTGGYAAGEILMQGLQDPDEKMRVLCIRWIGRLRDARAVNRLMLMLEDNEPGAESPHVKKEIIVSLGEIMAPECHEVLMKYQSKQKRFNRAEWLEINQAASEALRCLTAKFPHLERKR